MFDPIIYIEIILVVVVVLMQKVYTEKFSNIISNISLSLVLSVSMLSLMVFL